LIVVTPVAAPIDIAVPAPAKFNVDTVAFNRLNVVCELVMSPPLTAMSPVRVVSPVTARAPDTVRSWENIPEPITCSASLGEVTPIPTYPDVADKVRPRRLPPNVLVVIRNTSLSLSSTPSIHADVEAV